MSLSDPTSSGLYIYRSGIETVPASQPPGASASASASVPVDAGKAGYMWLAGCGISYDAVNRELEQFSGMLKSTGRPFVDMNLLYREFIEEVGDVDLAYLDGVHPTPAGHEFIAGKSLDLIEREGLYK